MTRKLWGLLPVLLVVAAWATPLQAQTAQSTVIGIGIGPYRFSNTDDLRDELSGVGAKNEAGHGQIYLEWYPADAIGFGARYLYIGSEDYGHYYIAPDIYETHRWIDVHTLLVTAQWFPFDPHSYARPGLLAGLGVSRYHARITFGPVDATALEVVNETSQGTAMLASAFLDWGGDDIGGRVGIDLLSTDVGDIQGLSADASGLAVHVDLRWAFP